MGYKALNNAYSTLAASINALATTLTVATGQGDRFPVIAGSDFTYITLENSSANIEIVKVTARATSSDSMTIERAQDGTTARNWASGDIVELRVIAKLLNDAIAHVDDTDAAHAASAISFDPTGTSLSATTEQAAIVELDTDRLANTAAIAVNAAAIAANAAAIASNDTDIAANAAAIASNDTDIAANAAAISANESAITALDAAKLDIGADSIQIGTSETATNNFVLKSNVDGTLTLARGNDGATSQDVLTVDAEGKVTLAGGSNEIGVGQTWQDVSASRAANTEYTNTTGRPIMVNVSKITGSGNVNFTVDGIIVAQVNPEAASGSTASAVVPSGSVYVFEGTFSQWAELR